MSTRAEAQPSRAIPWSVAWFSAALVVSAGVMATVADRLPHAPRSAGLLPLAVLAGVLTVAGTLQVEYRSGEDTDALDLFEAVLAPVLMAAPAGAAIAVVMVAKAVSQRLRRVELVKAAFNVAQWAAATAAGAWVFAAVRRGHRLGTWDLAALVAALVVVSTLNHVAVTAVITLVQRRPLRELPAQLRPLALHGWMPSGITNLVIGVLFAASWTVLPGASALFVAPLIALHRAGRAQVRAHAQLALLTGLQNATRTLAAAAAPLEALPSFLDQVRGVLLCDVVELTLMGESEPTTWTSCDGPAALDASDGVTVPVTDGDQVLGVLSARGKQGFGGFEASHRVVLESLATELAGALLRGRLFDAIRSQQARLADIIDNTSDGIATLDRSGAVTSWNAGFAGLSGYSFDDVRALGLAVLRPLAAGGAAVSLGRWAESRLLPRDFEITARDGTTRSLSCSYTVAPDGGRLVIVARDVTDAHKVVLLREQEAEQRAVAQELQHAVLPPVPDMAGAELGVYFVCADDAAPTGGDLYDWATLPNGDLHLAVVDVVGHGVAATKGALTITHALRLLALQGIDLEHIVERADALVALTNPDLQATVVVGRYRPSTGEVVLAGGGHPPAVHVSTDGGTELVFAPGLPIGWPDAGTESLVRATLAPGEALVLYTDGVVEARRDIVAGLDALEHTAAEQYLRSPADLARVIVEQAVLGVERRDDALALVLRRPGETTPVTKDLFECRLRPQPIEVGRARREFSRWLARSPRDASAMEELRLVVSELCTNAVAVARTSVVLRAWVAGGDTVIEVEDDGAAIVTPSSPDAVGDVLCESGRGLFIVDALVDHLDVSSNSEHTVVRAVRSARKLVAPNSRSR